MPDAVTTILAKRLDRDLKVQVLRRQEGMLREMRYLADRHDPILSSVHQLGWSAERLEVLCGLNSFYQMVLGPLASAVSERTGILGPDSVILYGDLLRFDADRNRRIRSAHIAFMRALDGVPDPQDLMTAPRFDDLIFRLKRSLEPDSDS